MSPAKGNVLQEYVSKYSWESGPLKYMQKVEPGSKIPIERISSLDNTCRKGNVLPKYVSKYLWESGPLKYIQKLELGSKIPIERISGLENTCNTYFQLL